MTSHFSSIALIKSGLLKRSTLASTIIGVIPTDPQFNAKLDDNVQDNLGTAAVVVQVKMSIFYTDKPRKVDLTYFFHE